MMAVCHTNKWDVRFLDLAKHISTWSKDPSTKVGAVVVDDSRRIVGTGYNGFPMSVSDLEERYADREMKYKMIVHGELNAILFSNKPVAGCTLYTWPFMPCSSCAGLLIQSGIKRVVAPYSDNARWVDSFALTERMFAEAGVQLDLYQ